MYTRILLLFLLISTTGSGQELSVEKIWKSYEFSADYFKGFRSMNDGEHYSKITPTEEGISVTKHAFSDEKQTGQEEKKIETLIPASILSEINIDDYEFNADETKVLLMTESTPIYRRSYSAVYYLYDLLTGKLQPLDADHQPQTLAEYSPDGKKVSYIFGNNLYVKEIASNKVIQLTTDGKKNAVINGTTDWVYEEEFAITKAYGWSPDSKCLAYLRFDESAVKEFTMTYYDDVYPELYRFKYPKAGYDNSKVTAHLVHVEDQKSTQIELGMYAYIPRLKWSHSANQLIIQTLNRHQNHLTYHLVDVTAEEMTIRSFFEEKSDTYIEIDDNLLILEDGKTILRTSEQDGHNHIYKLGFDGAVKQITSGDWDVIEFLGIDEQKRTVYYTSAEPGPIHKAIYKIGLDGQKKKAISETTGYNDAEFSTGMKYFVKTYSDANTPPVISLCDNEGKCITVLEANNTLKERLKEYKLSPKEFITFEGTTASLNGWMIKPKDFDAAKQYPVYMNIYGGPGYNTVTNSWDGANYMYHQLLAQHGYIVVSVDPRGTMFRGADFKKSTYLQLGKLEIEDIISVAGELQEYSYVDASRIGIMGWSYGGFMTSLAMTKGADYFKMGIAVAPVTNWRYYDNIYTERFMRTPDENEDGYDLNSPIHFADRLKGKYLLIHGSGDDNVHYQNSMEMINAMVKADKQFDLFIYPNKNHGIYGGNTRNHLFNMMLRYTLNHL